MENLNLENESCLHDCKFCTGCEEETQCLNNDDLMSTKLEFIDEVLENFGKISLVTNYFTAKEIALELGMLDYEDYVGIDLQSDSYLYLVDITPNELFVIEPLKRSNGYYYIECDELIIDGEIEDELEEGFFNFVNAEEISVISFIDENESCDCDEEFEVTEGIDGLIDCVLEDIENGECPKCSLINLYRIAFEDGQDSAYSEVNNTLQNISRENQLSSKII